ncbi:MAG: hypothetical protein EZS28_049224 [Streblomastix strix]|uniref:Uncharacterized protein n=1 Tax=Streblomastix strix TaxID=222440 RepID=A0A5J4TCG9_9EUKA|nr:MAG: hypothetical protein EZS28_049224 [Streblomastix strix]
MDLFLHQLLFELAYCARNVCQFSLVSGFYDPALFPDSSALELDFVTVEQQTTSLGLSLIQALAVPERSNLEQLWLDSKIYTEVSYGVELWETELGDQTFFIFYLLAFYF